jgi:hypothetical protein
MGCCQFKAGSFSVLHQGLFNPHVNSQLIT